MNQLGLRVLIFLISSCFCAGLSLAQIHYSPPLTWDLPETSQVTADHVKVLKIQDQFLKQGVPLMALRRVLEVYFYSLGQTLRLQAQPQKTHNIRFQNHRYVGIADFTPPSTERRFYLLDLEKGTVEKHFVSHGSGSGSLYAKHFSNNFDSHQTSLGLFLTGGTYQSRNFKGTAMKLYGVDATNSNAFARLIVMHPASYASESFISIRAQKFSETKDPKEAPRLGLSQGCFAFDPKVSAQIIEKLKGGALIYSYIEGAEKKILESPDFQEIRTIDPETDITTLSLEEALQREIDPAEMNQILKTQQARPGTSKSNSKSKASQR